MLVDTPYSSGMKVHACKKRLMVCVRHEKRRKKENHSLKEVTYSVLNDYTPLINNHATFSQDLKEYNHKKILQTKIYLQVQDASKHPSHE